MQFVLKDNIIPVAAIINGLGNAQCVSLSSFFQQLSPAKCGVVQRVMSRRLTINEYHNNMYYTFN